MEILEFIILTNFEWDAARTVSDETDLFSVVVVNVIVMKGPEMLVISNFLCLPVKNRLYC